MLVTAAALVLVAGLSGCSAAERFIGVDVHSLDTSGFDDQEGSYLKDLFDGGVITGKESRTSLRSLVDVGHFVCLAGQAGVSDDQLTLDGVKSGASGSEMGAVMAAARAHLC
jgi:hypothetical protein